MKDIMLSVVIVSYNQENYIDEAIESVLNQKTKYKYEIILADDCSSDNTFKIQEEYAKKYPKIIQLLKREKNLGTTQNELDASLHSNGKYITKLDGDDYWIDEEKIEKQISFLEEHPEYNGITHPQEIRNMKNETIGIFPNTLKEGEITLEEYCSNKKRYPYTSTIYRNFYKKPECVKDMKYLMRLHRLIEDAQAAVYILIQGKLKVINDTMVAYRMRSEEGESNFNSNHKINEIQKSYIYIYTKMEEYFKYKYNFYKKYEKYVTIGTAYSLLKFNFKEAGAFIKMCPKKYRAKVVLLMPVNCIKILYKKLVKKQA